jgi:hypothetical protein
LAQRAKIAPPIIARIVVEMVGGEDHPRAATRDQLQQVRPTRCAATPVTPRLPRRIEPASVRQAIDRYTVRPVTALAQTPCSLEPEYIAQRLRIGRVEWS